jgi:hypothetical protein
MSKRLKDERFSMDPVVKLSLHIDLPCTSSINDIKEELKSVFKLIKPFMVEEAYYLAVAIPKWI